MSEEDTEENTWEGFLINAYGEAPPPATKQELLDNLKAALDQQRKYQRENWPFTGDETRPPVMGEDIAGHLASLYCWPPQYVLSLPEDERDERLAEIWKSFSIAGDIISRYEKATVALLKAEEKEGDVH